MNSHTLTLSFPNSNALSFVASTNDAQLFAPIQTGSTADLLLRVAAKRQFVRAVQSLRRR